MKDWVQFNFFKLLIFITIVSGVFYFYHEHKSDIKAFLNKKDAPISASEKQPIFIMPNGNVSNTGSGTPILVNVTPQMQETTAISVKPKADPKTSPDVKIEEFQIYKVEYNGKTYNIKPEVKEVNKLDKNGIVISKESSYTMKIEYPLPRWSVGLGYDITNQQPAALFEMRLDKKGYTELWIAGSPKTIMAGIKFNKM